MGKTTCSWCYGEGHKVTTCEQYFEYLDRNVKYHGDIRYLTPKEQRHYKAFIAKKEGKKTGAKRKCAFCGNEGHNLRTCKQLQALKEDYKSLNKAFRIILERGMKGYGPGAMVAGLKRDRRDADKVIWSWVGVVNTLNPEMLSFGHFASGGHVKDFSRSMQVTKLSDKWHEKKNDIFYNPIAGMATGSSVKTSVPFSILYEASFSEETVLSEHSIAGSQRKRVIDSRKEATSTAWMDLFHWQGCPISGVTGSIGDLHTHSTTTMELLSPGSDVKLSNRDPEEGWNDFMDRVKYLSKKNRKNQDLICYASKLLALLATIIPRNLQNHVPERYKKVRTFNREVAERKWAEPNKWLTNYNTQYYLDVVYEYQQWESRLHSKQM